MELLIRIKHFCVGFIASVFIVDFSIDTRYRALYAMYHIHARNFAPLFARNVRTPFVAAKVPCMRT